MGVDVKTVVDKLSDEQLVKAATTCDENTDAKQLAEELTAQGTPVTEEEAAALVAALNANGGEMKLKLTDADVNNVAGGIRFVLGRNCWY